MVQPFRYLAAVAVLGVVLIAVLILVVILIVAVLVVVLVLILVLVIHGVSSVSFLRQGRSFSMPRKSGFILRLEQQAGKQASEDGNGNSSGAGFQPAGKDSQETILIHCFFYTIGQGITEAGQRD